MESEYSGGAFKQGLGVILMPTKVWKPLQEMFVSDPLNELSQNLRASLGAPWSSEPFPEGQGQTVSQK